MTTLESSLKMLLRDVLREVVREELRHTGPQEGPEYLTPREAAKLVSVSASTIREWSKRGLKTYGTGHVRRVKASELREFLEHQGPKPVDVEARVAEILAGLPKPKAVR